MLAKIWHVFWIQWFELWNRRNFFNTDSFVCWIPDRLCDAVSWCGLYQQRLGTQSRVDRHVQCCEVGQPAVQATVSLWSFDYPLMLWDSASANILKPLVSLHKTALKAILRTINLAIPFFLSKKQGSCFDAPNCLQKPMLQYVLSPWHVLSSTNHAGTCTFSVFTWISVHSILCVHVCERERYIVFVCCLWGRGGGGGRVSVCTCMVVFWWSLRWYCGCEIQSTKCFQMLSFKKWCTVGGFCVGYITSTHKPGDSYHKRFSFCCCVSCYVCDVGWLLLILFFLFHF